MVMAAKDPDGKVQPLRIETGRLVIKALMYTWDDNLMEFVIQPVIP
jgi:hypothetical protein